MKAFLKYGLILLLVPGVFVSTVGITVFSHTCHSENSTSVSIFKEKSCCEKKSSCCTSVKVKCCETRFTWAKTSTEKRMQQKFSFSPLALPVLVSIFAFNVYPEFQLRFPFGRLNKPPPLSGEEILLLNQVSLT